MNNIAQYSNVVVPKNHDGIVFFVFFIIHLKLDRSLKTDFFFFLRKQSLYDLNILFL